MNTSVSIRRQNYWGPSWDWLLEPDTVRFLIFVFLVSVSPLIFPLICIPSLHFTHSLHFSSLDSFIPQQFLIPYFILPQWVTGDTEVSHMCSLTFQSSSLEQEHSMVFLSLLKATPNISHTWFRPQDFPETCFSTLIHHQTTNLTPKTLMYSRFCWSFQVETKDGIISYACMCDKLLQFSSVQSLSRVQLFETPWIAARQASLSITNSQSSLRLMSIESVMPSSHLILCRPLLLLPPIPPSIRVFSNESTLRMR